MSGQRGEPHFWDLCSVGDLDIDPKPTIVRQTSSAVVLRVHVSGADIHVMNMAIRNGKCRSTPSVHTIQESYQAATAPSAVAAQIQRVAEELNQLKAEGSTTTTTTEPPTTTTTTLGHATTTVSVCAGGNPVSGTGVSARGTIHNGTTVAGNFIVTIEFSGTYGNSGLSASGQSYEITLSPGETEGWLVDVAAIDVAFAGPFTYPFKCVATVS